MRNLAIDMGNTRIKGGVFSDRQLVKVLPDLRKQDFTSIVAREEIEQVIVSSVVSDLQDFELQSGLDQVVKLTPELPVPIKNSYASTATLGMDRLAGVIGAYHLYKGSNCLVVDAGTTVTYDFVDQHGEYFGGGIAPGIELRFRSLNQNTVKLPLVEGNGEEVPLIGKDTMSSIRSGVLNGIVAEIDGIVRRYRQKFPNLKVIICGGDAGYFESRLKAPIFVVPHLVLIGLNSILIYHAQNK